MKLNKVGKKDRDINDQNWKFINNSLKHCLLRLILIIRL